MNLKHKWAAAMERLYEVYDNEQVQLLTRRQAYVTSVTLAAAIGVSLVLALALKEAVLGPLPVMVAGGVVWAVAAIRLVRHREKTNHVAWCIKISADDVTGYDYARRKTTIPWLEVRRVELASNGLVLHGEEPKRIQIPHLFSDFPSLSHRLVERAEVHGIPVTIEGEAWERLDVYALFPFLATEELK